MEISESQKAKLKKIKREELVATPMQQAIEKYYRRLRLLEQPEGEMRFGFWYPSSAEQRYCCNAVLKKGLKNASTLLNHCRSHVHIAFTFGVSSAELLYEVKKIAEAEQLEIHEEGK